nr:alpha/beta fold hydrolase [Leptolyngbya sp. FACHB-36]
MDQLLLRPSSSEIQLALLHSYGTNSPLYPQWQEYFRQYQPPTLIVWGKNDYIFPAEGAYPYQRDLKDVEFHLFNTGHFALEEERDNRRPYSPLSDHSRCGEHHARGCHALCKLNCANRLSIRTAKVIKCRPTNVFAKYPFFVTYITRICFSFHFFSLSSLTSSYHALAIQTREQELSNSLMVCYSDFFIHCDEI